MYKYLYSPLQESKVVKELSHAQTTDITHNCWRGKHSGIKIWTSGSSSLIVTCHKYFRESTLIILLHACWTATKGQILRGKAPPAWVARVLFYYSYIIRSGKAELTSQREQALPHSHCGDKNKRNHVFHSKSSRFWLLHQCTAYLPATSPHIKKKQNKKTIMAVKV